MAIRFAVASTLLLLLPTTLAQAQVQPAQIQPTQAKLAGAATGGIPVVLTAGGSRPTAAPETRCTIAANGAQSDVECVVSAAGATAAPAFQVLIRARPPATACDAGAAREVTLPGAAPTPTAARPVVVHAWTTGDCAS